MKPRYRVTLTPQERKELEALTKTGKTDAKASDFTPLERDHGKSIFRSILER